MDNVEHSVNSSLIELNRLREHSLANKGHLESKLSELEEWYQAAKEGDEGEEEKTGKFRELSDLGAQVLSDGESIRRQIDRGIVDTQSLLIKVRGTNRIGFKLQRLLATDKEVMVLMVLIFNTVLAILLAKTDFTDYLVDFKIVEVILSLGLSEISTSFMIVTIFSVLAIHFIRLSVRLGAKLRGLFA